MLLIPTVVFGQKDSSSLSTHDAIYKANIGIGVGSKGIAFSTSIMVNTDIGLLMFRYCGLREIDLFLDPPESVDDIALMYGLCGRYYAIAIGISNVYMVQRGAFLHAGPDFFSPDIYEKIERDIVGLSIQVELSLPFFRYFGFSLVGFADINAYNSYTGFALSLDIGKLY